MSGAFPSAAEVRALGGDHVLIPVRRELLADMLTPVQAQLLLCGADEPGFLLESVLGGEQLARYSFIGYRPVPLDLGEGDPLIAMERLSQEPVAPLPGLPRFLGGAVGYLGYETARHFERLPLADGPPPGLPDSAFLLAENLVVFDHVRQRLQLLTLHRPAGEPYEDALGRLDEMEEKLRAVPPPAAARPKPNGAAWRSNVTRGQYESMVDAAREHILAGDAFQVVLSQRFSKPLGARPFDVYRQLRGINPSPYMYHLSLGAGRHVVGTSPPGSVRVERLMDVERYSHVMHMSSLVSGQLRDGQSSLDAVRAAFPAGTVSGAPKIRAMEIIADLEPDQRGCYAGALGYVGFGGNLDLAITLRTIVIADGMAHVQAGAGVVADSVPSREYEETLEKAGAMFAAIERAEAMA
jgi:anthranilate synthase component 1